MDKLPKVGEEVTIRFKVVRIENQYKPHLIGLLPVTSDINYSHLWIFPEQWEAAKKDEKREEGK